MKTINCAECNVEYTYEPVKGYPDKRKYCANCSEKKQASWNEKTEPIAETVPMNPPVEKLKISKEFHLSPEQVRTNALDLSIKILGKENYDVVLNLAAKLEKYLWNGK